MLETIPDQFSMINTSGDNTPSLPGVRGFNICLKPDIHHEKLGFHAQLHSTLLKMLARFPPQR